MHNNGDINSGFRRIDQAKACAIHGYEIKNDFADIALTQRQEDGSWLMPKPVLALHLDKYIKPSDIIADSITFEDTAKHSGWDCREEDLEHMENQEVYREHFDIKKELNPVPQRHFVGRNGPKQFLRISSFVLKNDIRICSVSIPKGTPLSISEGFTCGALIDGAVDLERIPRRIFPASMLSNKGSEDLDQTTCMPIPRKFNHIENFKASPSFSPFPKTPKIDWNKCDCDSPGRQFD